MKPNLTKICVVFSLATALNLPGCSDTETPANSGEIGGKSSVDESGGGTGGGASTTAPESSHVYGIGTMTFGAEGTNDYLLLVNRLENSGKKLDLDAAREFSGQSDVTQYKGSVLVASGDEPTIVKYRVEEDLSLTETGRISFLNYGLTSAAFWNNQFVAIDKAYMVNGAAELIIWNPETMEIEGTIELPKLASRDGMKLVPGLADRASLVYSGKFYLPLYWTDDNYAMRSDDSVVVKVDIATDRAVGTIAANCPGLDYGTVDDEGTLYFSNWTGGAGTHYVLGTAHTCIAAIEPGTDSVSTTTFASLTEGHEGAAFKYVGDNRFVMSVFDEVRADVENASDPFTPVGGLNWRLYGYEVASGLATPVKGIDYNSGAIIHNAVNGTVYSMVPGADYASTVVYSLDGDRAEAAFAITGWSFRLFQVR